MEEIQLKIHWKDAPYIVSDLGEYSNDQLISLFQLLERYDGDAVDFTLEKNETGREIKKFNDFNKEDDIKIDTTGFIIAGDNYYLWCSFFGGENDEIEGFLKVKDPVNPTRVKTIQDPCDLTDYEIRELKTVLDALDLPSNDQDLQNAKVFVGLYELIEV